MVNLAKLSKMKFTTKATDTVTFLPEPEPRERMYTIISVDDHVVEPPDLFEGRLPSGLADRAPRVVEDDRGHQLWQIGDRTFPNLGFNAVAGRPIEELGFDPVRFEHMRPGAYDIEARIKDMDINGVYASLNFSSALPGFVGQNFMRIMKDEELALACVRAWNDWLLEDWYAKYPTRIIPCQLPWMFDPVLAAEEVRRNAERGFVAVSFSEAPEKLGLPSLHTGHWDPLMEACEDTGTVVCLHVGSSSSSPSTAPDAPPDTIGVLFFGYAMFSAVDFLYSRIPVRFPNIKIAMSEGGIAWVPGLLDRLDHVARYQRMYGTWDGIDVSPAEVMQRNFWFCTIEDPSCLRLRDRIGVDHIMLESDYPHVDSTWPNTQAITAEMLRGVSDDDVRKVTWENAATLFRVPVPERVQHDPNAF
jgi:predicted TIM-barrel fold metal-dependent hydrolase